MSRVTPTTAFEASLVAEALADWLDQAVRGESPEEILHAARNARGNARALKRYLDVEARNAMVKR